MATVCWIVTEFRWRSRCWFATSSVARVQMALIVQEQWRKLGVKVDIETLERSQCCGTPATRDFDVVMENVAIEPSPWSLIDRWGCGADGNYGHYCNATADSLLRAAHLTLRDPAPPIRAWLQHGGQRLPRGLRVFPGPRSSPCRTCTAT